MSGRYVTGEFQLTQSPGLDLVTLSDMIDSLVPTMESIQGQLYIITPLNKHTHTPKILQQRTHHCRQIRIRYRIRQQLSGFPGKKVGMKYKFHSTFFNCKNVIELRYKNKISYKKFLNILNAHNWDKMEPEPKFAT